MPGYDDSYLEEDDPITLGLDSEEDDYQGGTSGRVPVRQGFQGTSLASGFVDPGKPHNPMVMYATDPGHADLDTSKYESALDRLSQAEGSRPKKPDHPKWYQRLAAAAAGAAGGYVNADPRNRPVDMSGVTGEILAPGYRRKLTDWQHGVDEAKAVSDVEGKRLGAKEAIERIQNERAMRETTLEAAKVRKLMYQQAAARAPQAADQKFTQEMIAKGGTRYTPSPEVNATMETAPGITAQFNVPPPPDPVDVIESPGGKKWQLPEARRNGMAYIAAEEAENLGLTGRKMRDGSVEVPNTAYTKSVAAANGPKLVHKEFTDENTGDVTIIGFDPETMTEKSRQVVKGVARKRPTAATMLVSPEASARRDRIATAIANGNLTDLRDVTSMRGNERELMFDAILQKNPTFNTAELKRQIKAEDEFTNGKDGQALQSFGTFLEHAGEASDTVKKVQLTDSRLANKPLNWWRQNVSSSPDYQRLMVSLEPVRKEFESFLLGGKALYTDDRQQMKVVMDDNSSPAQIQAALSQMGKTAKDRYLESNHRYQRVRKQDIPNPFSPEAIDGARKIGLDLSIPRRGESAPASGGAPAVGTVKGGYKFKGGDPAKQENWEKAGG